MCDFIWITENKIDCRRKPSLFTALSSIKTNTFGTVICVFDYEREEGEEGRY